MVFYTASEQQTTNHIHDKVFYLQPVVIFKCLRFVVYVGIPIKVLPPLISFIVVEDSRKKAQKRKIKLRPNYIRST